MNQYDLQYQELLQQTALKVIKARIEEDEAMQAYIKVDNERALAMARVKEARQKLAAATAILDARIQRSPREAVDQFYNDTGEYPTQV